MTSLRKLRHLILCLAFLVFLPGLALGVPDQLESLPACDPATGAPIFYGRIEALASIADDMAALQKAQQEANKQQPLTGGDLLRKQNGLPPEEWEYQPYSTPAPPGLWQLHTKDGKILPFGPFGPPLVDDNLTPEQDRWIKNQNYLKKREEIQAIMRGDIEFRKFVEQMQKDPELKAQYEKFMLTTPWKFVNRSGWPDMTLPREEPVKNRDLLEKYGMIEKSDAAANASGVTMNGKPISLEELKQHTQWR